MAIYYYLLFSLSSENLNKFSVELLDIFFAINADFLFIWATFERAVATSNV